MLGETLRLQGQTKAKATTTLEPRGKSSISSETLNKSEANLFSGFAHAADPRGNRENPPRQAYVANPWGPLGPLGALWGPMGPHGPHGPHGAHGAPWAPSSPVVVRRNFEKIPKICISPFLGSKMGQKKVEIEGVGPP